jgi:uncharacterized protein (TIGR02246 family)
VIRMSHTGGKLALALAAGLVALAFVFAACGDDGDGGGGENAAEVEAAVRAAIQAWNDGDAEAFLAFFTDDGIMSLTGFPRAEVEEFLAEGIGDPQIEIQELSVDADDETATAELTTIEGAFQLRQEVTLIMDEEGVWKGDAFEPLQQDVPEGTDAVDVSTVEYSFEFDESEITSGNLAFNVSNIGGETHEMLLVGVPEDLDVEEALQSEEEPEGIEDVGFIGPWPPGVDLTAILVDELQPGRYVMLCFVPAADGEPHALKGMWAEFTIGGNGGDAPEENGETEG